MSLSEFVEFAKERELKVQNDVVYFGENSRAANDFYIEAKEAGFDVIEGYSRPGRHATSDEYVKLPPIWFVRVFTA